MSEFDVVHSLPEAEWQCFVDETPSGNIFHTPEMFQVFAGTKGFQPALWAAVDGNRRPQALLIPVQITLKNGLLRSFTTRTVSFGSVVCVPGEAGKKALGLLLASYVQNAERATLFTELRNLADTSLLQPVIQAAGFDFEDHNSYIVDLALPAQEVWNHVHKSARKNLRKAQRKNLVTIREIDDKQMLSQWYGLIKKSFSWSRVPLTDLSLFEAAFDVLHSKRMIQFLIGSADGQDIAASVALLYKGTIYGWYRGFDRRYAHYMPNDQMVWHILEWGAKHGYKFFDFGGAGRPKEEYGPRIFKAKFGGSLINYGRNLFVHAPFRLKISSLGYRLLRNFMS